MEVRRTGDPGPGTEAWIRFADEFDDGVLDTWKVEIGGSPLMQVPGKDGLWEPAPGPLADPSTRSRIDGVVHPMKRTYLLSRLANHVLQ